MFGFPQDGPQWQAYVALLTTVGGALCIALTPSCGGGGPDEPAPVATHTGILARIVTEARVPDGSGPESIEVAAFRLTAKNRKHCPWTTDGGEKIIHASVRPPSGSKDPADLLPALVIRGEGKKSFTHEFPFQSGEVNSVELLFSCYGVGTERLRVVTLDHQGEVAEATEAMIISARPEPHLLKFVLPRSSGSPSDRSGIRVELDGRESHSALLYMAARRTPLRALMPAAGVGAQVAIDHSSRLAAGLIENSPWRVDFDSGGQADGTATLRMSFLVPAWSGAVAAGTSVSVDYDGEEGPANVVLPVQAAATSGWQDVTIPLEGLRAGPSALRLSLLDEDPAIKSVLLVGDAVLTQPTRAPKTVLLITSDTHRSDHMGLALSNVMVETPALDRLGRRGVYFTDCQSTTNVTNPSHIAILSGIHPRDTQIVDNTTRLTEEVVTLAEVFQSQGYRTFAAISTQHLEPAQSGLGQGFDRFESTGSFKRRGDEAIGQIASCLEDSRGANTFVWLHLFDAHTPFDPPANLGKRATDGISRTAGGLGLEDRFVPRWLSSGGIGNGEYVNALYRAEVDWVDASLTDLLESPRLADAWVAFTADHGEGLGTHRVFWDHAGLYLPIVSVPLIIVGPDVGVLRSDTAVQQFDVGRTLINLAGIENTTYPGRDLVKAAIDEAPDEPRFAIAAHGLQASISIGRWFYVMDLRDFTSEKGPHQCVHGRGQLFDRTEGINTEIDHVEEQREQAERMRARLIQFLASGSSNGLGRSSAIDEAAQANLDALGYAGFTARTESYWFVPRSESPDAATDRKK